MKFSRLSSGSRINQAKDDAAGLSISTRMSAREKGIRSAIKNANDYLSLYQTAEGALTEMNSIMQRMRELAVQSANLTNNSNDRAGLQEEIDQLKSELDRIAKTTNFNNIKILDGTFLNKLVQNSSQSDVKETTSIKSAKVDDIGKNVQITSKVGVLVDNLGGDSSFATVPLTFVVQQKDGTTKDISIRETTASDDTISPDVLDITGFSKDPIATEQTRISSAIAKAKAINDASQFTGVRAVVGETRTDDDFAKLTGTLSANPLLDSTGTLLLGNSGAISAVTLGSDNIMMVNGVALGSVKVEDSDATGSLRDEINRNYEKTGVNAEVNAKGELVLVAKDGRNIMINYKNSAGLYNANLASKIGLRSATDDLLGIENLFVYSGKLTLISDQNIQIKGSNNSAAYDISEVLGGIGTAFDANGDSVLADASQTFIFGVSGGKSVKDVDISIVDNASNSLITLDYAIDQVSEYRAGLGAKMNRLDSTIQALNIESQNLNTAVSRIKDTDFSVETTELTQNQIIQQAAVSVLAQANANNAQVLALLKSRS